MTIGTIGENAVRTFDATAGQKLTLTVTGNTIPGVSLIVRQPNNATVSSLFVSAATGFLDTFTLPVTGTYTLIVDPAAQNTGGLTFTLGPVPDNTGTTTIGTATSVTIGTIGENAVRTFDATAGQKLTLTVTGNTIPGVSLIVRQPNNGTVSSLFVSAATGFLDTFTLPVTGTYTLIVDPAAQNTGGLTFTLGPVPDNTGTTTIGTATSVTIGTIGENAVRTFDATAGQKLTLTVTGNTIPGVSLIVRQPNNATVSSLFVSAATGFLDTFTLPVTGTYTLIVDPAAQNTGGLTFTLGPVPDNTGTTTIGTATSVTIGTIGENAVRTFDATAGQKLTLTVTGNTIPGVSLIVRQPNNATVSSLFVSAATGFLDTFTLPVTGTYTLIVDPAAQNTGGLTFTLNNAPTADLPASQALGARSATFTASREQDARPLAIVPAAAPLSLTLAVSALLANDRPGPDNESGQTLTITAVRTDASSHGTATLSGDTIVFTPDAGYIGPASFFYTACDDGTTNGQPDPLCSRVHDRGQGDRQPPADGRRAAS